MTVRVLLGHGASGTAESMRPYVEGLRARGIDAAPLSLPRGSAERAIPRLLEQVGPDVASAVIGGHSFGGRVASMVAAQDPRFAGLVLISYPLHRPGHPEDLRVTHWPRIRCPVLLLSGEADPFARIDLLRECAGLLAEARTHTYPGVGHGLTAVLEDAVERIARFLRELPGDQGRP